MKTVIQIPALVEATSSDEMVEASISLSVDNGQITLEIPEWESRIEIPAEHLTQALATLAPTEKEPAISPVLVQHLGQKVSRLEQQIAATPQQRLELEAMGETLEALRREVQSRASELEGRIEGAEEKVAEMQEQWPHALLNRLASQCGHFENAINLMATRTSALDQRIEGAEATIAEHHLSLSVAEQHLGQVEGRLGLLENNLAEPPAEVAAMALYGGEQ